MGDYHGAIDVFNKAHQLQPSEVYTLKYRANMKHLLHDFQGSLHDLDKAHALQPQDPYILKERVALKVMMKDYQGAMGGFGESASINLTVTNLLMGCEEV